MGVSLKIIPNLLKEDTRIEDVPEVPAHEDADKNIIKLCLPQF